MKFVQRRDLILPKQNPLMIDWTFLCTDLCSPVKCWVIHHPVVHHVRLSVEPANNTNSSSPISNIVINGMIFGRRRCHNFALTLGSICSCIEPEHRRWLRPRTAAVRWQYQHTQHLDKENSDELQLGMNRVCMDTVYKFRWHSLMETSREVHFFITHLCVLWFGWWRGGGKSFLLNVATVTCPSWITPVIR